MSKNLLCNFQLIGFASPIRPRWFFRESPGVSSFESCSEQTLTLTWLWTTCWVETTRTVMMEMTRPASPTYLEVNRCRRLVTVMMLKTDILTNLSDNTFHTFTEDLMSLLDADIHSAHPSVIIDADAMFSEDISYFGYPSFRRSSLSRLGSSRGKGWNTVMPAHTWCHEAI